MLPGREVCALAGRTVVTYPDAGRRPLPDPASWIAQERVTTSLETAVLADEAALDSYDR